MTLRLKDRELQRKLDELSDGEFTYRLQDSEFVEDVHEVGFVKSYSSPAFKFFAYFNADEVEEVQTNTSDWIDAADHRPPKNVPMQVEIVDDYGNVFCYCAYHDGCTWRDTNDDLVLGSILEGTHKSIRYKKWNN